ncbi:MAG: Stp1/IreP family PP2C-type Ser/Thr phosphatase [Acidimicrobiales bacterium]
MAHSTVTRWAGATDVGRVRSDNQDSYLARPGLWVVADGMGGHRGGEIASGLACEAMENHFGEPTVEGLVEAIDAANAAIHNAGNNDPDLSGMGTTVVAIALVDEDSDEVLAVANVGDSRAYRLTGGQLEQLTEDHSLVADMVREGSLSPEEAATHPQRNILTRVLGVYDEIPVDILTIEPHDGERYLLCSDGLFNEVTEDRIAAVLRRLADPDDAAEELVRLAVEGGGRDNVTAVILDVLSDGGQAEAASAALASDADLAPFSGGAYTAETVDERRGRRFRRGRAAADAEADAGGDEDVSVDGDRPRHRARGQRRVTWRVVLFLLLVLGVVGGAFALVQWYARSTYYVGFSDDEVAIFRGRPGGVAWIDPTLEESTGISREDVPADSVDALVDGQQEPNREEAEAYVDNLRDRIDRTAEAAEREESATTTTTTRPPGTTTTTAAPAP